MTDRCCANCVFAKALCGGEPGMFICVNRPEAMGEPSLVRGAGGCPRFEAKPASTDATNPRAGETALITLTQNKVALVDRADFERLSRHRWHAKKIAGRFYACRKEKGRTILMHREIMQAPKGMVVDHKKPNTLDDRRKNLRTCTQAQNRANSRPHGNKSGFKGVYPQGDKWYGLVEHRGKQHYVGTFDDPAEAARARDRMAIRLFGEYAWLNFPNELRVVGVSGTARLHVQITARLDMKR